MIKLLETLSSDLKVKLHEKDHAVIATFEVYIDPSEMLTDAFDFLTRLNEAGFGYTLKTDYATTIQVTIEGCNENV